MKRVKYSLADQSVSEIFNSRIFSRKIIELQNLILCEKLKEICIVTLKKKNSKLGHENCFSKNNMGKVST